MCVLWTGAECCVKMNKFLNKLDRQLLEDVTYKGRLKTKLQDENVRGENEDEKGKLNPFYEKFKRQGSQI